MANKKVNFETDEIIMNALNKAYSLDNAKPAKSFIDDSDIATKWENALNNIITHYTTYASAKYAKNVDYTAVKNAHDTLKECVSTALNYIGLRYDESVLTSIAGRLELWTKTKNGATPYLRYSNKMQALEMLFGYMLSPRGLADNFTIWKLKLMTSAENAIPNAETALKNAETVYNNAKLMYDFIVLSVGSENSVPECAISALNDASSKLEGAKTKLEGAKTKLEKLEKRTEEEWQNAFKGVR